MNIRLRLLVEWAVVALLSSLAILLALQWRGTAAFDNLVYDQLSSIGRPIADDDILLVSIDDPSLSEIGKWPWPRRTHAELIAKLEIGQPRSILLDILLSESGPADDDAALAKAMSGTVPVYLPVHFVTPGSDGRAYDTELPTAQLAANSAGLGHVNVEFDSDGRVRRIALCFQPEAKAKRWPHIVEMVARNGAKPTHTFTQMTNCNQTLLIPYAQRGSFAEISYSEALKGGIPGGLIKGRDIIVGATAAGSGDSYPAPFSDGGLLSGAEIMANVLAALRRDNFIRPVADWLVILLSIIPSLVLLLGFLRLRPRNALLVSIGAVVAILLASSAALSVRYWFPPGAALIGIFLIYPLWGWRRLQAMSDFMGAELGELESEGEVIPVLQQRLVADDLVGRQSERLAGAIDHMRDLRRFVADTLEHMPDPMMVTDLAGGITLTNELLDEGLGHDVTGAKIHDVLDEIVHPQFRRQVDTYLSAATRDVGAIDLDAGSHFVRFDSTGGRTFVLRTAAIRSDANELRGHIHYFTDITDLAHAEADREIALQLLSHDMRAPQSAIIALLPDLGNKPTGERIERHARRTMQLAQDFVDIARMGENAFEGTDILLADLLRDVADTMWPLAREKGISIEVQDESGQAFVFAEPDSLSRALSNLIDNAIKYSPEGSTVRGTVRKLQVDGLTFISVSIEDEGEGIDPEIAPRLFERFASSRSDSARVKGIGLGLAFVRAVAEKHQGNVNAENRIEGGARFVLSLPEAPEPDELQES